MSQLWVVIDVGCLHCEAPSSIVGSFADRAEADRVAAECLEKDQWRDDAQHNFVVFEVPDPKA